MEIDAQNLEASLRQANTPKVEQKPITLGDATHPLSFLFTGQNRTEDAAQVFTPDPTTVESVPQVNGPRKPCIPDGNDVVALGKLWFRVTQEQPSCMKFEALLGKGYSVCEIEAALRIVQAQERPMSSDGRLYAVECVLEGASDAQAS